MKRNLKYKKIFQNYSNFDNLSTFNVLQKKISVSGTLATKKLTRKLACKNSRTTYTYSVHFFSIKTLQWIPGIVTSGYSDILPIVTNYCRTNFSCA